MNCVGKHSRTNRWGSLVDLRALLYRFLNHLLLLPYPPPNWLSLPGRRDTAIIREIQVICIHPSPLSFLFLVESPLTSGYITARLIPTPPTSPVDRWATVPISQRDLTLFEFYILLLKNYNRIQNSQCNSTRSFTIKK